MKIHLLVTNQHELDTDMVSALEEQYVQVRLLRDKGWDGIMVGQHYLNEGNNKQLQMVPFLARLQAEAGEMTLGTGIMILPLYNPVDVAETVASLDVIAKGNFIFGVGLGYREKEFDAFAAWKGTRVKRFEETLDVATRLWQGEEVTYRSDFCKLEHAKLTNLPIQKPYPTIWFAAHRDPAVRRAARLGHAWYINPNSTPARIKQQLAVYKDELAKHNVPFPAHLPCRKEIFCAKDRDTAIEMAGPYMTAKYRTYAQWFKAGKDNLKKNYDKAFEDLLKDRFILGSPEECYEQLRPYWEEIGCTHFVFRTQFVGMPLSTALHSLRLISDELLPELHKAKPRLNRQPQAKSA
ncbi:MAG: LLM class flavin-dependent oxidoreductase [Candidatus Lambdaproteobacteria bacterium]|nr:LLM class flavin-dependent oxidoreductase [Candidatus Lambdaproteobacteria bacterium]